MDKKGKIKEECTDCHGTGLYSGMCEANDEAVICCGCNGQGWCWHHFSKFDGRKKKRGIKTIRISQGAFILTGVGGTGKGMTYSEFEKHYPVKEK